MGKPITQSDTRSPGAKDGRAVALDRLKTEFRPKENLGLWRGEIYRIVPREAVADVDALIEEEKQEGIKGKRCWVPFRKGDPEGNKWVSLQELFIRQSAD